MDLDRERIERLRNELLSHVQDDSKHTVREVGVVDEHGDAYLTHGGHGSWVGNDVADVKAAAIGECGLSCR